MTYNEKKSLYEKIMWDVAKVVKRSLNEMSSFDDDDMLGDYGQFIDFYGEEYWELLEDKLKWALSRNTEEYLLTIEEVYDEGDEYPMLLISDVLVYQDGKYTNGTTEFDTPEECRMKYKEHTCPGCDVKCKLFKSKTDLYEYIHKNYDGYEEDGEYCITKQLNWQ